MKNDYIEYPKLRVIPGTDIAHILVPCAVNEKNGFDKYIDYLASKVPDAIKSSATFNHRTLREYCYKLYKLGDKDIDSLAQDIKNNTAELVGDVFFSTVNQDFEPDDNGNLLLRSYGSDLEKVEIRGGDVLIDRTGKVLKNTKGHMFIHAADPFGNYPCDVFVSKSVPMTDKVNIVRIDYNFLTPDGKLVRRQNFVRSDTPTIQEVDRTYSVNDGEKVFIDSSKTIYPKAYVYDPGKLNGGFPMFFPSPAAILIENRNRILDNKPAILEDETPYIAAHYQRCLDLPTAQQKLTAKSHRGTLSFTNYIKAMHQFAEEEMLIRLFESEFETDKDRDIRTDIESGDFTFEGDNPTSI